MDKLKHYLREHRDALDVEIPPADLWQHIQAGSVAQAAKAMLIKYIVGIGIVAAISTGAWLAFHKQKPVHIPAPVVPVAPAPNEVIQKDTVPDTTVQPVPVIKPKKKKIHKPPSPPVIRKHKKSPDTVVPPTPPRRRKKALVPVT